MDVTSICFRARALMASANGPHRLPRTVGGERALEHEGAARAHEACRIVEASRGTSTFDDDVAIRSRNDLVDGAGLDALFLAEGERFGVAADDFKLTLRQAQDLSDEQTEPPRADDGDLHAFFDRALLDDLKRGRERFDEDRLFVGHGRGHLVQIRERDGDLFGEASVASGDADDGAVAAVVRQATQLMSATTRLPRQVRGPSMTVPTNSCPSVPEKFM
jgi:hypothetical protein